ncbi:Alpha/beta hydrolase family protein [Corynebacterium occultum]|uniref:Alpha/beta hydrolase family protein n=1 Tax=Corynebacterium occultum TaxID=2675219 RepID=A0A6B8W402_9CORY|nr:PHB depolymerase family esterase [Corynebacterium occultum]QGU08274.1 Alpha/beta hydrolase family protein [Corynebacterium occultum]
MSTYRVAKQTLHHQGRERSFQIVAPTELSPGAPVLLYFHGSRQSANVSRSFTAHTFDDLAERSGALIVYPEGVERHFNDAREGLTESARTLGIDDVGFTRALIDHLSHTYRIDTSRVFAAGYSNGGQMVIRLLHDAPELLAGAATLAAPVPVGDNLLDSSLAAPVVPRKVLIMHGTGDPIVPYQGGPAGTPATGIRGYVRSAPASAEYFATRNGITAPPTRSVPAPGIAVDTWAAPGREPVQLWTLAGVGHVVPAPKSLPATLGATTGQLIAADVIAEFFGLRSRG